jgi:tetratricopeptide (TPR) repeat protein
MRGLFGALFLCLPLAAQECASVEARLAPALKAMDSRDLTSAELALLGLSDADRQCPATVVVTAHLLIAQRRYPQADALSETALTRYPNRADILALRGQLLTMKGATAQGKEVLERALKADPKNADAHFWLGSQYDRAKQNADAVEHFRKAVESDPSNPQAWDYLGLNLEPLGQVEKAEDAFRRGLAVNQGARFDYFLDFNYGRLLLKLNRLDESKVHLDRAVELVPQARAVRYERAKLNLRRRDYTAAREDAEKARELNDPAGIVIDLQVYGLLEQIYRRLGDTGMAAKYAELSRSTPVPPKDRAGR